MMLSSDDLWRYRRFTFTTNKKFQLQWYFLCQLLKKKVKKTNNKNANIESFHFTKKRFSAFQSRYVLLLLKKYSACRIKINLE